jgi:Phosphotransferase enzyme family
VNAGLGTVLTHGDCHVGNLLLGPGGRILWTDWQEVCLSTGLDDLVFLWQRAEFDGARPPRDAMTSAYAAARSLQPDDNLRSALGGCELRSLLVGWPAFLDYGGPDRRQLMIRRFQQLVDDGVGP